MQRFRQLHLGSNDQEGAMIDLYTAPSGFNQGMVFPSAGWARDFYWSSMARLARVFVE